MSQELNDDYAPHAIILPSYTPVAVCLSRDIAEKYAEKSYPSGKYTIRKATKKDLELLLEDYFTVKECK